MKSEFTKVSQCFILPFFVHLYSCIIYIVSYWNFWANKDGWMDGNNNGNLFNAGRRWNVMPAFGNIPFSRRAAYYRDYYFDSRTIKQWHFVRSFLWLFVRWSVFRMAFSLISPVALCPGFYFSIAFQPLFSKLLNFRRFTVTKCISFTVTIGAADTL